MSGKKVIIFNGKPKCGKDSLEEELSKYLALHGSVIHLKNTTLLIKQACAVANISIEEWMERYEQYKDVAWDKLNGYTQRQWICYIAEEVVKPHLGKAFYGKQMSEKMNDCKEDFIVITDGGFKEELLAECDHPCIDTILLFRVNRPGGPDIKDTREDLSTVVHPKIVHKIITNNEGELATALYKVISDVNDVFGIEPSNPINSPKLI